MKALGSNKVLKNSKDIGDEAETAAAQYLTEKGYVVLERNYRYKKGEIDIIASKEQLIVFVEVKYRSRNYFGNPEEFVSESKMAKIQETAESYLEKLDQIHLVRFDVVAVERMGKDFVFTHFEDAF